MTDQRCNDIERRERIERVIDAHTKRQEELNKKVFSGDNSELLWDAIIKLCGKKGEYRKLAKKIGWIVYDMGCRCQELETKVDNQAKEIEAFKRRLGETPASSAPITDLGSLSC